MYNLVALLLFFKQKEMKLFLFYYSKERMNASEKEGGGRNAMLEVLKSCQASETYFIRSHFFDSLNSPTNRTDDEVSSSLSLCHVDNGAYLDHWRKESVDFS